MELKCFAILKSYLLQQVLGTALAALGTWARIRNDPRDMVFDRSYRLRYNKGQNHLDFVTYGVVGKAI